MSLQELFIVDEVSSKTSRGSNIRPLQGRIGIFQFTPGCDPGLFTFDPFGVVEKTRSTGELRLCMNARSWKHLAWEFFRTLKGSNLNSPGYSVFAEPGVNQECILRP